MAKMKQKNDSIYNQARAVSELFATDIEESRNEMNEYVHAILDEASSNNPDTQEKESVALKLVPGETLLKTMEGLVSGQPQTIKIYYGNYVTVNGSYRPFKTEVYEKTLEEFLSSEEGARYERPSKEENEAAISEVKRVMDAYQRKQELIRSSNILQPGRTLPASKTETDMPASEKKMPEEEQQRFSDDPPSEEAKGIEFIRNKNYSKQFIDEARKEFHSEKRRSVLGMVLITLISTAVLVLAVFLIKDIVVKLHAVIELELKAYEITIRAGDSFNAADYVKSVSDDEGVYIVYPNLDTKNVGIYKLDYVATNGIRNVKKTLKVFIIDGDSPVITLTNEELKLVRNRDEGGFDPLVYVKEVHDNIDPDEDLYVEVNSLDWSKDEQSLTYRVKDSAGNAGNAVLLVKIEDKAACDPNAIYNSTTNTCRCKSGYTGDGFACSLIQSAPASSSDSSDGSSGSASNSGSGNSNPGTSWSESWTVDYTDYQPSNGQTDVTYTNNNTGESYTVSDSDSGPYESDEDLWNEIDNLGNP